MVRTIEVTRIARAVAVGTAGVYVFLRVIGSEDFSLPLPQALAAGGISALSLTAGRGFYRDWLARRRADGQYSRPVLVVGSDLVAKKIVDLIEDNRELGFTVAGVLGYPGEAAHVGIDVEKYLVGSIENAAVHIRELGVSGVIVSESAIAADERTQVLRTLLDTGVHVQMTSGVPGVDQRRVRSQPLARQPMIYLEPTVFETRQLLAKRAMDVLVSGFALLLASPFLLLGALAVKLYDRGPIFTRLPRVGANGRIYHVATLRTVLTDDKLHGVESNELIRPRRLWSDPYRTPVGRVLEATCINELPQLWSVVRGDASLVGPKPVSPENLAADHGTNPRSMPSPLRPGLTGLWRVEARYSDVEDGSTVDDFYVENWSVTLDLVILLSTMDSLMARLRFGESWRRRTSTAVT